MDLPGQELPAGPVLADDQDIGVGGGYHPRCGQYSAQGWGFSDDAPGDRTLFAGVVHGDSLRFRRTRRVIRIV